MFSDFDLRWSACIHSSRTNLSALASTDIRNNCPRCEVLRSINPDLFSDMGVHVCTPARQDVPEQSHSENRPLACERVMCRGSSPEDFVSDAPRKSQLLPENGKHILCEIEGAGRFVASIVAGGDDAVTMRFFAAALAGTEN